MPPQPSAAGAIPVLLDAELTELRKWHSVTLATVAGPGEEELEAVHSLIASGAEVHAAERRLRRGRLSWRRRLRIVAVWSLGRWPFRTAWFWEPALQSALDRLGTLERFDVAVVEDNAAGIYRLPPSGVRILTEHEVRTPRRVAPPPVSPARWPTWAFHELDWARWRRYHRTVWRRFDLVQVFTERDRLAASRLAPGMADRFRVNPFPVALPHLDPMEEEPDSIVFVGNFSHPPNVDAAAWLAAEIMPLIRTRRAGVKLRLIGDFAPPALVALGGPDVEVLGRVGDAAEVVRRSPVVVAPVRTGGGMRMKVLQAMALGKAVVTTTRGTEGLTTQGRVPPLAVADDAEGIATAVVDLLGDERRRRELGRAARCFVEEHHSPRAYVRRLESTVDEYRTLR